MTVVLVAYLFNICLFQLQSQLSPCTEYNNQVSYPLPWKPNIPIEAIGKIIASLTSELYPITLDHSIMN